MRVVAGTARGRVLRPPPGRGTRPTGERVREAMFDILSSMHVVEGASVLDLFAGSGALGIEALSRGASSATFVEADRTAADVVRTNLRILGDADRRGRVVEADARAWLRRTTEAADLVFADPPYAWAEWASLLDALAPRAGLLVAEVGGPLDPGPRWDTLRSRRYGSTVVAIMQPSASPPDAARPSRPVDVQARGGM